jgi:AcrR family transcriptional regulator
VTDVKGHGMTELSGQARRGEKSREAIVDAALGVFAVRGYRSSALAEIAEKVGISPAGILYHFGSKECLLVAVIAERDRRAGDLLTGIRLGEDVTSLRELVRIAELCEQQPGLAALHTVLQAESFEPGTPAHVYFRERAKLVRSTFEQGLRKAQRLGTVRADIDCTAKTNEFVAFLEGASVLWLLDNSVSLVDLYRNYIETFIATILPPPA